MMRMLSRLMLVLFLCLSVVGPLAAAAPTMALRDAAEAAEKSLEKEGVALDQYFLYSVTLQNDSSGGYWKCTFRPVEGGRAGYGQIFVKVYMNGTTDVSLPDMPVRYRR